MDIKGYFSSYYKKQFDLDINTTYFFSLDKEKILSFEIF